MNADRNGTRWFRLQDVLNIDEFVISPGSRSAAIGVRDGSSRRAVHRTSRGAFTPCRAPQSLSSHPIPLDAASLVIRCPPNPRWTPNRPWSPPERWSSDHAYNRHGIRGPFGSSRERRLQIRQFQVRRRGQRKMIGGSSGERRVVNSEIADQAARPAEDAIQREDRPPCGETQD